MYETLTGLELGTWQVQTRTKVNNYLRRIAHTTHNYYIVTLLVWLYQSTGGL